jgi:hypothetical protein
MFVSARFGAGRRTLLYGIRACNEVARANGLHLESPHLARELLPPATHCRDSARAARGDARCLRSLDGREKEPTRAGPVAEAHRSN